MNIWWHFLKEIDRLTSQYRNVTAYLEQNAQVTNHDRGFMTNLVRWPISIEVWCQFLSMPLRNWHQTSMLIGHWTKLVMKPRCWLAIELNWSWKLDADWPLNSIGHQTSMLIGHWTKLVMKPRSWLVTWAFSFWEFWFFYLVDRGLHNASYFIICTLTQDCDIVEL